VRAGITSALALENPTDAQWPRHGSATILGHEKLKIS
jgi:hypothetical protein